MTRLRLAITAIFFVNGALFASWASRIPAIADHVGDLGPGAKRSSTVLGNTRTRSGRRSTQPNSCLRVPRLTVVTWSAASMARRTTGRRSRQISMPCACSQ